MFGRKRTPHPRGTQGYPARPYGHPGAYNPRPPHAPNGHYPAQPYVASPPVQYPLPWRTALKLYLQGLSGEDARKMAMQIAKTRQGRALLRRFAFLIGPVGSSYLGLNDITLVGFGDDLFLGFTLPFLWVVYRKVKKIRNGEA